MSKISYQNRVQTQQSLFGSGRYRAGAIALRQGQNFGATWASVILGPDLSMPGMLTNNPPTANGSLWDGGPFANGPAVRFNNDANYVWVRGHLVNGEWHGPGNTWSNLVPLTPTANHNHATIEGYMRNFSALSLQYDNAAYRPNWYGIAYQVQCATAPWALVPANGNLYSYTPNFIKVSWRAVTIVKPDMQANGVQGFLDGLVAFPATVPVLPFAAPLRPGVLPGAAGNCLPALNNAPGGVVYPGAPGFPAAQLNGFDGDVEIHQN